uniref:Uncharacterized protein n=1 Tax=Human herpesvirus 2 TaxID=10310 RepID=A0A481TWY2_HHV2|nr:hypothetical protein [Human alphaherpesvirus 2]
MRGATATSASPLRADSSDSSSRPSAGQARPYTYPIGPGGTLTVVVVLGLVSMAFGRSATGRNGGPARRPGADGGGRAWSTAAARRRLSDGVECRRWGWGLHPPVHRAAPGGGGMGGMGWARMARHRNAPDGGPGVGQGLGARLQRRFERPADGGPELGMLGRGGRYMYGVLGGAASGPAHGPPRPARHRQGAWPPF